MGSHPESRNWIIVGAGLTGLSCAQRIEIQTQDNCLLLEQSDQVGGALKTEIFENNYLLDHGFQVLLPAYSELQKWDLLKNLNLKFFESGAIIHSIQGITKISDPLKHPSQILATLFSSVGSIQDKFLVVKLLAQVRWQSDSHLLKQNLGSSLKFLKDFGFSDEMIHNFWQPFFSGIFLEDQLMTEGSYLEFLFKMFSLSPVAVPQQGISTLPKQMVQQLTRTEILLNKKVSLIEKDRVHLSDGTVIKGTPIDARPVQASQWGSVSTLYYAANASPVKGPWLVLNSRQLNRLVNHVAVMSEVSPDYAKKGDSLISVNVLKTNLTGHDREKILMDLKSMFGPQVDQWRFLKSFEIPKALPLCLQQAEGEITPSQQGAFKRAEKLLKHQVNL
jgi:protoporphyrinogen oxidase